MDATATRAHGNRFVQRVVDLMRSEDGEGDIDPEIERTIHGARGGGHALDSGVRARMEPAFKADFGGVRVHTDSRADTLNRSLRARAFTTGQDIFFKQGEYSPAVPQAENSWPTNSPTSCNRTATACRQSSPWAVLATSTNRKPTAWRRPCWRKSIRVCSGRLRRRKRKHSGPVKVSLTYNLLSRIRIGSQSQQFTVIYETARG
ncbi:MAG: DUF4157 domain-containing protein [Caldilineaceae bacterium]